MDNFERTDAGNLTDEGIRQYLLAKFNRVTKIKDKRIKELEEIYLGQIRVVARSRLTYKKRVERMAALAEQALKG